MICENAVKGYYDHAFFHSGTEPERRLCANLMNKHFDFAETLQKRGAYCKVVDEEAYNGDEVNGDDEDTEEDDEDDSDKEVEKRTRDEAIQLAREKLKISRGRE